MLLFKITPVNDDVVSRDIISAQLRLSFERSGAGLQKQNRPDDWLAGWFSERDHTQCVIVVIGLHLHGHCDGINCAASAYTCGIDSWGGGGQDVSWP